MATIRREFVVDAPAQQVWDVFRDVGAVHTRLAPGFVTDCRREGDDRIVMFANGLVAKELIVDVDDAAMRLVYSARSERLAHHNASFQVFSEGPERSRIAWIADVLPHAAAGSIGAMMDAGVAAMKKALVQHSPPP
jgi:carbon monoxide dehydrogenase subunit G